MTATQLAARQPAPRPVESVQRAIELLSLFADPENDAGVSVSAAARSLGVSKSTVSRLMATLAAGGLIVAHEETRRYRIGAMAFVLGNRFWGAALAQTLRPIVRDLAGRAGSTAQIGMLQDQYVLYLLVAQGEGRLRVVASAGDQTYAHASAMGKAILAELPPEERLATIEALAGSTNELPEHGPRTIRDVRAFNKELDLTHRRGYSTSNEESTAGVSALGVAINHVSGPRLAISVAFPAAQYASVKDQMDVVQHLRVAAAAIENKFTARRSSTIDK